MDLESGALILHLTGHVDGVKAIAVTPDGRMAVSGSRDRTLKHGIQKKGAKSVLSEAT